MENKTILKLLKQIERDLQNKTSYSVDYLLSNDIEETLSIRGIKVRKFLSPILRMIYKTQTTYKLIRNDDKKVSMVKGSKIFVINHRQADDIVLGANAVGENGYIVFGNKYLVFDTTNGLGLWANGIILLDRDDKQSRQATYDKMKYILKNDGNIIIYPEGYWNLDDNGLSDRRHGADDHNSENWLIQDINIGVIRLAKELGCPIIPVILHYDETNEKICYSKKGKTIYVKEENDLFEKKDELVTEMQSVYFELMQKYSNYSRNYLERNEKKLKEQWLELKKQLVADCDIENTNYKLDLQNEKLIGKAKILNPVVSNEEAFEHLNQIQYNKNNAFLLCKKLTGRKKS